jgi:basic membrane protein A and related proteins
MKKYSIVFGLLLVISIVFAACTPMVSPNAAVQTAAPVQKPMDTATPEAAAPAKAPLKACMVTDSAGIGDKSFNDAVWNGLVKAKTDFGIEANYIESKSADDYAPNLQACVDSKPDLIVCVGFLMADACDASIKANPSIKYIGIDIDWLTHDNFVGVGAYMDQSCFQAGYLAAGMTKTGKVATYTGIFGPVVQIFMDGFYMGVQKYNEVHKTTVGVLGYDPKNMDKASATGDWADVDKGRLLTESFTNNGADIVLPVAGNVGTGSAAVMKERGSGYIFGVDQDWTLTNPQYSPQILGSVLKKMDVPVYETIKLMTGGGWKSGNFLLTLANKGTELAYNSAITIPAALKAEVDALAPKIISGEQPSLSPEFLAKYPRK